MSALLIAGIAVATLIAIALIAQGIAWAKAPWEQEIVKGLVKEIDHVPETRSSGSAVGIAGGGISVHSVSSSTEAVHSVVIVTEHGKVETFDDEEMYAKLSVGDRVSLSYRFKRVYDEKCSVELIEWEKENPREFSPGS